MHDKPTPEIHSATDRATDELLDQLAAADPAEAPDIADALAARLESGLAPAVPDASQPG